MSWTHKSGASQKHWFDGQHRFEHWYRDNQIYFITSRCRGKFLAFRSVHAKEIFWEKFDSYTLKHGFTPCVTSLMDNHYHTLGYLRMGNELGPMMRNLHGSVAKLVNDTLETRLTPFWVDTGHQGYFDGCIRDEKQCRRAYRYTLTQCSRRGICQNPADYPHTRVIVGIEPMVKRAIELKAFLEGVVYRRYQKRTEPGD